MKKLTTWEILHSLDMAISLRDLYTITTQLLVRLVDEPTKLLGALFAVIATVFVFRESRQQPVRGTGSPHRDVRQLRCMPSLSFDFSRHGFGHGGRYRFGRDRDDTFEPRGPHLHYGDHDRSCLGRRTIELARSVAARMLARAADGAEVARAAPAGSLVAIFRLSPFFGSAPTVQTGCAMATPRPTTFIQ